MSAIFENESLGPTERLIMLALADHADDSGRCYPSIQRLCQRTGLGERAVQINIRKLVDAGYLSILMGGGKSNSNVYFVSANPAVNAPYAAEKQTPHEMHPAPDAPQTPHFVRSNPAPDAPEPSGTIIEPSEEGKGLLVLEPSKPDELAIAVAEYNAAAEAAGWPKVQTFSPARRSALKARMAECGGLEGWRIALAKAGASPHCCGQNSRGWTASFDFLTQASSFTKLMEGNYDPRTPNPTHDARNLRPGDGRGTVDAFAAVAARYSGRTQ